MAVADELDRARAALQMINPAPYNAEAPPKALIGDITPVALHYVRSNFALPAHDGTLEVGGAVANPITLTLDDLRAMPAHERTVTLECAGNGRLETRPLPIGEPWGDYAVPTARWTGALLHEVLEHARPAADGVDVRFEGADHGAYHLQPVLAETDKDDLTFVRALPLTHAADPAAEILIAYEMNGARWVPTTEPLFD
jgi:DMSO/TMAO reductase YedYZ molybdopterin-dependent catalytic subunit